MGMCQDVWLLPGPQEYVQESLFLSFLEALGHHFTDFSGPDKTG